MKHILLSLLIFSLRASAQTDSASMSITVQLPVKAVIMYGYYISETPAWSERKTPDILKPLIGTGTKPDSLVNATVQAGPLFYFITRVISEKYESIRTIAQSIFNNSPAITGYTALFTQITGKANGNTSEKAAATYLINRYNAYTIALTSYYTEMYGRGLSFIQN